MQLNALCNRFPFACILGRIGRRFITTTTEGRSGHTAKNLRFVTKTLRVMQLTAILLTVCTMTVTARSLSQSITFSGKDVPLQQVFEEVERQTNFFVFYNKNLLSANHKVSIDAQDMPLADFLFTVLKNQPLTFSILKTSITIEKKPENQGVDFKSTPNISPSLSAPPITVRGRIVNETGEPVVASIMIKGFNKGVTSSDDGSFVFNNIESDAILIVSGANIQTREIKLNGQSTVVINVTTKITAEDEVVINGGYYKTTKRTKTGNISRVDGKDIKDQPVTSPLMALQGRAAGVDVFQSSGGASRAPTIRIRGQNSLRFNGGYPLYVIDGVPMDGAPVLSGGSSSEGSYDPLSTINPADIASIEILKDADATSIYGSRGANGVVLISTVKASGGGKTSVDMNVYHGVGKISKKLDLLNTQEYLVVRREAFKNNDNEEMNEYTAPDFFIWDTTRYTDWQELLLGGNSQITDAQASLLGGNANTSFRFSGGYHKETTIFPGDFKFERFTGSFSINHVSSNRKFRASLSANYGATKNYIFDQNLTTISAYSLPPNAPKLYNEDGTLNWAPDPLGGATWVNPMAPLLVTNNSKGDNLVFNGTLSYNVGGGVLVKTNFGYTNLSNAEAVRRPRTANSPALAQYITPEAEFTNTQRLSWIMEPQIVFNKRFDIHGLDAVVGTTFQQGTNEFRRISATNYSSDGMLGSLRGANTFIVRSDDNDTYRYTAVFARLGYDYKEKYLLNLTARRDGSSKFGTNNRFANFGAVGAAWIFSKEKLIADHLPFISLGKLRGSIGTTGNDQIGDYKYIKTFEPTPLQYQNVYGLLPSSLFNPDFQWEVSKKIEAAAEFSLFNGRANVEVVWYRNRSSNLLIEYQLPGTSGLGSVLMNLDGTVENRGWEYTASADLINKGNFRWSTSINYSSPKNELIRFDDLEESTYANQFIVGRPLDVQRLYHFTGVDPETGFFTYLDVDNNGTLGDTDKTSIKNTGRTSFGGIQNSVSFKGIELSVLFQFVNLVSQRLIPSGQFGSIVNVPRSYYENRWRKAGDIAGTQKYSTGFDNGEYANFFYSDASIEKSSFFRLKTLSLSYSLPKPLVGKTGLSRCRINLQGQNLFTLTNYSGLDPETGNANIPPLRMILLGIQLGI